MRGKRRPRFPGSSHAPRNAKLLSLECKEVKRGPGRTAVSGGPSCCVNDRSYWKTTSVNFADRGMRGWNLKA